MSPIGARRSTEGTAPGAGGGGAGSRPFRRRRRFARRLEGTREDVRFWGDRAERAGLGCRLPVDGGRSRLTVRDAATDRLAWKWGRGVATSAQDCGTPTSTTDYHLCLYGDGGLLAALTAPAGPSWRATARGFRYENAASTPSGIHKLVLQGGGDGHARIILKGRGAALARPALPIAAPPVHAQLVTGQGACWETALCTVRRNTAATFVATD